jgi:c-di-GMP-binding flagellar brake protein YcgR
VEPEQLKDALKAERKKGKVNRRKSARYEVKTLVSLEIAGETLTAVSIDIGEHGLAVQATEPVPISSNLTFRCVLPGTDFTLQGHVDVIWASDQGRAGLFFSKLSPAARKHLKRWLNKRSAHHKEKEKNGVHELMPPADEQVSYSVSE